MPALLGLCRDRAPRQIWWGEAPERTCKVLGDHQGWQEVISCLKFCMHCPSKSYTRFRNRSPTTNHLSLFTFHFCSGASPHQKPFSVSATRFNDRWNRLADSACLWQTSTLSCTFNFCERQGSETFVRVTGSVTIQSGEPAAGN
jgi:hypothetical protein